MLKLVRGHQVDVLLLLLAHIWRRLHVVVVHGHLKERKKRTQLGASSEELQTRDTHIHLLVLLLRIWPVAVGPVLLLLLLLLL